MVSDPRDPFEMPPVATMWTSRGLPGIFTHFRSGQRIVLDPRDPFIAMHFLEHREWEEHLEPVWQEYLQPAESVFIDVGASIGMHAIRATKYNAHIHAFEPDPDTFALLSLNLAVNGARSRDIRNVAVSAEHGKMEFAVSSTSTGLSGAVETLDTSPSSWGVPFPVDTVRLDDVVMPSPASTLLKIDVEGHEVAVLRGAQKFIQESPQLGIVIEFHRPMSIIDYFKATHWYARMFEPMMYRWQQPPMAVAWEKIDEWVTGDLVLRKRRS